MAGVGRGRTGGQQRRQRPILRLAAGGPVNGSGAGHVWVGRRDSPAAETDATVVRLNSFCQAPPSTGQKQTQMLVASVRVRACVCARACAGEKEHCLTQYQAPPGTHPSRAVMVGCSVPPVHLQSRLQSLSLFLNPVVIFHHPSSPTLSFLFSCSCSPSLSIFTPSFPLQQSWLPLQ